MKKVVLTLHGVESRGEWQKELAPLLCAHGLTPYLLDYGSLPPSRILAWWIRSGKVDWLNDEIDKIREKENVDRPSIIAHSFGTYILAQALKKYPAIRLDSVVLCGSIVDPDFDWKSLFDRGQLNTLRNESGGKDMWAGLVKWLQWIIPEVGPSGRTGFTREQPWLHEEHFPDYKHSDFFQAGHARKSWLPFLKEFRLDIENQKGFRGLLDYTRTRVASELNIPIKKVRANIMLPSPDGGHLYIPSGFASPEEFYHVNAEGERELDIRIPIPMGSVGAALKTRGIITAPSDAQWGSYAIPQDQLVKAHPGLKWITSTPVPDPFETSSFGIIGVLNVDFLQIEKTQAEISQLGELLKNRAKHIATAIKQAYCLRR